MDKYYTQIIRVPVLTDTFQRVGQVYDVIFNTDTGKVIALSIAPGGHKVITPIDIIAWDKAIIIGDADDVSDVEDIYQLQQMPKRKCRIFRKKVITKDGEYLGRVIDFAVHNKLFCLTKIVVAKNILSLFFYRKRLINSQDIIEIRQDAIIVKNPLGLIPLKKLCVDASPSS